MKKLGIIILLTAIILQGFSQNVAAENQNEKKQSNAGTSDEKTSVSVGRNLVNIEENDSSVNIRVGSKGLRILESLEGNKYKFEKFTDDDWDWNGDEDENARNRRRNRFKGHWSGVEFGFNNYLTSDKSNVMPDDIDYMSLHSSKSNNFNINFSQLSLGITRRIGFVTGLGFNWNNYRFDGQNNITKGTNGVITGTGVYTPLKKSKFTTAYLTLPFMLEVQLPVDNNSINLAAGPIGALKLGSHSKMVAEDGQKIKSNSDFSLNMLRYGATARVGYGNFQLYGTYYMTPLFKSAKGPGGYDLYPFELGVAFTFND
ncbi:MAG: outer membrane beta-barrel protein [Bacteroidales bacterium]|nr:outer membrane beta-barrel protein [Bacteroidales bacterium]MBK7625873.1 outer membrane beta-barrel protein [Bacteroidales bacterium]